MQTTMLHAALSDLPKERLVDIIISHGVGGVPATLETMAAPLKAVRARAGRSAAPVGRVARGSKRTAKVATPPVAKAEKAPATTKRSSGAKRDPAVLAELQETLRKHIAANPGQGTEAIGKALGQATKDLQNPLKKLLAAHLVRVEGEKRASRYFPSK